MRFGSVGDVLRLRVIHALRVDTCFERIGSKEHMKVEGDGGIRLGNVPLVVPR